MTPGARVAAAIEVLDAVFAGQTAEVALKSWARGHRFAGSKDRAAIRDHVFQALRCRSSYAWLGGAETGRGVMLGAARAAGAETELFTGEGYAPPPANAQENGRPLKDAPREVVRDMPAWLLPHFDDALGDADEVLDILRDRAGVFLRVNLSRSSRADAAQRLAEEGLSTADVPHVKSALQVTGNERKISQSKAYSDGLVELQDTSSQIATLAVPMDPGAVVLDYCAGGGGKALALADRGARVVAHDVDPKRMADLPNRAARAAVKIEQAATAALRGRTFDVVFVDAPCSGSGTWRRTPEAKWSLTPERLQSLTELQLDALTAGASHVRPGGILVYATCSVFSVENEEILERFLSDTIGFRMLSSERLVPTLSQDGFYYSVCINDT